MEPYLYKIVQSHMYEIYAILAGTITLLIMNLVKIPIKQRNYISVYGAEHNVDNDKETAHQKRRLYRRKNFIIIILTGIMAPVVFFFCALASPQITFQSGPAILAGLVALAEYTVLQQIITSIKLLNIRALERADINDESKLRSKKKHRNFVIIIIAVVLTVGLYYFFCVLLQLHHKLCCSLKAVLLELSMYAAYEQLWGDT